MNIRLLSDVHLEFIDHKFITEQLCEFILPTTSNDHEKVLVMAGDMCTLKNTTSFEKFLGHMCHRFMKVIYVFGNHEYYRSNIPSIRNKVKLDNLYDNLEILDDQVVEIGEYVIIGSTLWADCDNSNPTAMYAIKNSMNDFRLIRTGPSTEPWRRKFSELDMIAAHKRHKEFIIDSLENMNKDQRALIVTHHAPSFMSVSPEFKGSILNGGYASDLSNIILDYEPAVWVHGHMHRSCDYFIGKTRIACNPRGYPSKSSTLRDQYTEYENKDYKSELVLTF